MLLNVRRLFSHRSRSMVRARHSAVVTAAAKYTSPAPSLRIPHDDQDPIIVGGALGVGGHAL